MPYPRIRAAATLVLAIAAAPLATAIAAEPKALGAFADWSAFTFEEGGHKVCYMSSVPKKREPARLKRGEVYLLITHRPAEKTYDVVSLAAGHPLKKGGEAVVDIGGKSFKLFTEGETAWARDHDTDEAMVAAMRGPKTRAVTMKALSAQNARTVDSYSLGGFSQAYEAIGQACGVKR